MKRLLCGALLCVWLCAGMAWASEEAVPEPYEPGAGYESLASTDIYAAPEEGAEYAGHLATGDLVTVLSNEGDWVQVEMRRPSGDTVTGWLPRTGIARVGSDMPYYGKAYVANPVAGDLLNLREGPGKDRTSIGLYYNGAEALCWSDPEEGQWVLVTIGQVAGYMQRQFLRLETEGAVAAATPLMAVSNPDGTQGLNLREGPDLTSGALGMYPNGQRVVVLGVSGDWAHVQVAGDDDELTTETGYMLRNYLVQAEIAASMPGLQGVTLAPADTLSPAGTYSPALQVDGSGAEGFRYFDRGYTVVCAVSELAGGNENGRKFYAHAIVAYDNGFEAADGITSFRLFLNGEAITTLQPHAGEDEARGPPTIFRSTFAYDAELDAAHLVPVLEAAGEHPAEAVPLMIR